jgi:hypothetical protein
MNRFNVIIVCSSLVCGFSGAVNAATSTGCRSSNPEITAVCEQIDGSRSLTDIKFHADGRSYSITYEVNSFDGVYAEEVGRERAANAVCQAFGDSSSVNPEYDEAYGNVQSVVMSGGKFSYFTNNTPGLTEVTCEKSGE